MTNCIGELTCIPPHGNSPESMCDRCEDAAIEARDKREEAVRKALAGFCDAVERLPDTRQYEALEAIVANWPESCPICAWGEGCKPGCVIGALTELVR